jgi:hypothetical protein
MNKSLTNAEQCSGHNQFLYYTSTQLEEESFMPSLHPRTCLAACPWNSPHRPHRPSELITHNILPQASHFKINNRSTILYKTRRRERCTPPPHRGARHSSRSYMPHMQCSKTVPYPFPCPCPFFASRVSPVSYAKNHLNMQLSPSKIEQNRRLQNMLPHCPP